MMIITRNIGEKIVIDNTIVITVLDVDRLQAELAIDAPKDVVVHRSEVNDRIQALSRE